MQVDGSKCVSDGSRDAWVKRSRIFSHWQEIKQEILQHKWYESERAGRDIGWERAEVSWQIRYGHRTGGNIAR